MSDVHKRGPLAEAGKTQPITVDLTRIDIRRGILYLPRRFYDALSEGELLALDTVAGEEVTVRFTPPRQLEGLGPFFEAHELRPNDGVTLLLSGNELKITPVRRDRRQSRGGSERRESAPEAAPRYPDAASPAAVTGWGDSHGPTVRPSVPPAGDRSSQGSVSPPRGEPTQEPRETGVVRERRASSSASWQRVLHDPQPRSQEPAVRARHGDLPRRNQAVDSSAEDSESTLPHSSATSRQASQQGSQQAPQQAPQPASQRTSQQAPQPASQKDSYQASGVASRQPSQRDSATRPPRVDSNDSGAGDAAIDVGSGERWHQAPRDLSRRAARSARGGDAQPEGAGGSRGPGGRSEAEQARSQGETDPGLVRETRRSAPAEGGPLAPAAESAQHGLFETPADRDSAPEPVEVAPREAQAERGAEVPAESGGAAGVGAGGDVTASVAGYLSDPSTPAIVRAVNIAEALNLPIQDVRGALATVASRSEGKVAAIRTDVYLVKRGS